MEVDKNRGPSVHPQQNTNGAGEWGKLGQRYAQSNMKDQRGLGPYIQGNTRSFKEHKGSREEETAIIKYLPFFALHHAARTYQRLRQ